MPHNSWLLPSHSITWQCIDIKRRSYLLCHFRKLDTLPSPIYWTLMLIILRPNSSQCRYTHTPQLYYSCTTAVVALAVKLNTASCENRSVYYGNSKRSEAMFESPSRFLVAVVYVEQKGALPGPWRTCRLWDLAWSLGRCLALSFEPENGQGWLNRSPDNRT